MDVIPQVIVNGLTVGGVYALTAIGVSLVFGVLNIANFGHGAALTGGAFIAMALLRYAGLNIVLAFAIAVLGAFFLGYLTERVAVRRLRNSPLLMPLITTLGFGLFLENIAHFVFGPATMPFPTHIEREPLHFGGTTVSLWEAVTLITVVVLIVAMQLFLHRTNFGKGVRAVAEDRRMAALLGIDVERIIIFTFCLASALGGVAGILMAALYNAVYPAMGSDAMQKGFAASVLGGMEVASGAILGGLLLGIVEAFGSMFVSSAWRHAISLSLLVLVLIFKPTGLLGHRQLEKMERPTLNILPLPPVPKLDFRKIWLWLILAVAIAAPIVVNDSYWLRVMTVMLLFGTLTLSLNIVAGFAGIVSLAQAAFYGVGAYASAIVATRLGAPFWVSFLFAVGFTGLFGIIFAWPMMRLRGHYVAMGSLGLGAIISIVMLNWMDLTRGPMGIRAIPAPEFFGMKVQGVGYYYFMLAILAVAVVVVTRVMDSCFGRSVRAMRDDDLGAESVGIDVRRIKMTIFGISAAIAGACGSFWAHYASFISPDSFSVNESISLLAMTVLGGLGSIPGSILGGALLTLLPEGLRFASDYRQAIYGLLMVIVVLFRPQGLLGIGLNRGLIGRPTWGGEKPEPTQTGSKNVPAEAELQ